MMNIEVDPKEFYFTHDMLVSKMRQLKSYLREKNNHLESIENNFLEDIPVHNTAAPSWIITHFEYLSIENSKKLSYCWNYASFIG